MFRLPEDEEQCWEAVQSRAREADGHFVYGVLSTGIYCRPSCPSRRPRRSGVRYFPGPTQAAQAGFRPCLRCRPAEMHPTLQRVTKAVEVLQQEPDTPLQEVAQRVGGDPGNLQRTFTATLGISPHQYGQSQKVLAMRQNLREGQPVLQAGLDAGFRSAGRIYAAAQENLGMPPASYGKGGHGALISYAVLDSALGKLLVAATERGVCFVALGESEEQLQEELRREFPQATLRPDGAGISAWANHVLSLVQGQLPSAELPLDVRATAFQWRVWQELKRIPRGQAISYGELARRLDHPKAVRAVARANATNPVALVHPCHRVIGSNGTLTGYRWGLDRKGRLLEQERLAAASESENSSR